MARPGPAPPATRPESRLAPLGDPPGAGAGPPPWVGAVTPSWKKVEAGMDRVPAVIDENIQLPVEAGREIAESLRLLGDIASAMGVDRARTDWLAYCLEQAGRR